MRADSGRNVFRFWAGLIGCLPSRGEGSFLLALWGHVGRQTQIAKRQHEPKEVDHGGAGKLDSHGAKRNARIEGQFLSSSSRAVLV